ncbi:leishmanolysin-related zinc metalloendopeptidase [Variovorax sp. J22R24]|uniref:leishmanolysin-related zinc metalloendopeptidase n=1 Tax=Variovorax gracilis TaxID=3053502 RepID=UPI002575A024|nr:leishmanolysin-related zinc metalloendopeptidase [Variovorax sp. J22R24]MDM0105402.1 leishmanolysin-related zinc metalloendopeptidase [Variovorax sp. J22R24]
MASSKKKGQPAIETFVAHASVKANASAAAIKSAYKIEVRFVAGLTATQKNAFKTAAKRWSKVIIGDLPSVNVSGEVIDDLLIMAQGVAIDGPGKILGQAGPTHLRPASAGANAFLPAKGLMSFDTADLAAMQADGTLVDVITHEMGHVIGIGTVWELKKLLAGATTTNPRFTGTAAKKEYGALKGAGPTAVPVENTGGPGTMNSHWRETVFRNELMSGFIAAPNNPLSRVTVASLQDLGYVVDLAAAEAYALPNLQALAEAGLMSAHDGEEPLHALPIFAPRVLPDDSLI